MTTPTLPEPLVPADTDLKDFAFMPLDVARLRDSDLAAEVDPACAWYALMLWASAWHQVPAGSIPNNDIVLAKMTGFGRHVAGWLTVKQYAMRGFVLCSDDRYYHPVVCEKALDAWVGKLKARIKAGHGNAARWNQKLPENIGDMADMLARGEAARRALKGLPDAAPPAPKPPAPKKKDPPPPPEKPKPAGRKPKLTVKKASLRPGAVYGEKFEEFWDAYPNVRRVAKPKCWEKWQREKMDEFADVVIQDVRERQISDNKWVKDGGQYVPLPMTYLNQGRWNDDFEPIRAAGARAATEQANNNLADKWAKQ